jgi:tetratricopeptide (TPR) repeat protein
MDLAGKTLGGYDLGIELGRGGMGAVYKARTRAEGPAGPTGTIVAVKVFHPDLVSDETTYKRFEREAELGIRIRHPGVVRTYEIGVAEEGGEKWHFIAMEFVEGQTLRDLLDEIGTLPEHLIYQIADQLLDALTAVHTEGMVHRDVKPENLVLTHDHRLLLMDLGVARLQQEGRDLTRQGEFVGSIQYAAPEQFMDQDHVGPKADIYAVGVVLYEMAAGRNPFGIDELSALINQKLRGTVRRPKLVHRDIDPFLDEVILTCIKLDPAERFADCAALREVLAAGDESPWWKERIRGESFPAAARALKRLRTAREAPLVGRGPALDTLHEAEEAARGGAGRALLVSGAAGTGKSRLVHDFLEELVAPDGPVLLAGRCARGDATAFHAFVESVQGLLGEREGAEKRLADLVSRIPENLDALLGKAESKDLFVSSFTSLLGGLAAGHTVVLVIEDLHRATPDSLELFQHLARSLSDDPVLLIGTYRGDEVEEGSPLDELVVQVTRETPALRLGALSRPSVDELVRSVVTHGTTVRALGRALFERSDGNPHLVLEMLAHLKTTGALVEDDGGWSLVRPLEEIALPDSIRELFALKLADLDDDQRETLEAAAVQGVDFTAGLLAAATGQRRIRLMKKLAVLERKHRLITSSGRNAFRFANSGLQHVVYEDMPEERRREMHATYADAIRAEHEGAEGAEGGGDEVAEKPAVPPADAHALVHHLLQAGRIGETLPYVDSAVRHAASQHHPAQAAVFLERLITALEGDVPEVRCRACLRLARLYEMLGRRERQWGALEWAQAEADRCESSAMLARVSAGRAAALLRGGDIEAAEKAANEGLALARDGNDRETESTCLHALGAVAYRRGEFDACATRWREALVLSRVAGDRAGEADALQALGAVQREIGEGDKALATKQEALQILRELKDRRGEGAALNNLANSMAEGHRLEEAFVCYEQAIQIAHGLGDMPAEAAARYNRGRALAVMARTEEARADLDIALDLYREVGDPRGEAEALDELGWSLAPFGERSQALERLDAARELAEGTGETALLTRVLRHLGALRHEAGDREQAWQLLERSRDLATARERALVLAEMGNAAAKEGDHERARRLFIESMAEEVSPNRLLLTLCRLARVHKAAGNEEEAMECAGRAEELLAEELNVSPQYGPEIYYSLGQVFGDERGMRYLERANEYLGNRTRSIRSVVHRQHYLTTAWPNREILEEARRLLDA